MRWAWLLLAFIAWLTGRSWAAGQDIPGPSDLPNASASAVMEKVLQDWTTRQSQLTSGELTWRFVSRARSSAYRASPCAVDDPQDPLTVESVRVRFNQDGLRFEGTVEPAIQFGRSVLPDSDAWAANREFRAFLNSGLLLEDDVRPLPPRPYVVLVDRQRETHLWTNKSPGVPCLVILPVGTAGPLLFHDATKAVRLPWMWSLIETMRLALFPRFLCDAETLATKAQLQEIRPQLEGCQCLAVDFPLSQLRTEVTCRLLIDPLRDSLVVRATFRGKNNILLAQYDLDYGQDETGHWWPKELTLVQFNGFGDPYDELRVVCSDLSLNAVPLSVNPPGKPLAETWVIDQVMGEQYVINGDGTHRNVSLPEAVAKLSPSTRASLRVAARRPPSSSIKKIAIMLVTWPWILSTLGTIFGASLILRRRQIRMSVPTDGRAKPP